MKQKEGENMFNPDNRRCASCEYYATYPGVCCNTKSPYAAGEREGYHSCDFWEKRIEGKFNKKNGMNQDRAEKKIIIELPCEIGDTVYIIGSKYRHGKIEKWVNTGKFRLSDMEKLNKTVFLTEEAAWQKLKEI